jgi:hypothetical protein
MKGDEALAGVLKAKSKLLGVSRKYSAAKKKERTPSVEKELTIAAAEFVDPRQELSSATESAVEEVVISADTVIVVPDPLNAARPVVNQIVVEQIMETSSEIATVLNDRVKSNAKRELDALLDRLESINSG